MEAWSSQNIEKHPTLSIPQNPPMNGLNTATTQLNDVSINLQKIYMTKNKECNVLLNGLEDYQQNNRKIEEEQFFNSKTTHSYDNNAMVLVVNNALDTNVLDYSTDATDNLRKLKPMRLQFFKTKLCPWIISSGFCRKASSCRFAHNVEEVRPLPDLRKTKLCPDALQEGGCRKKNCCKYAHSYDELRATESFNKIKLCRLWLTSRCPKSASVCRFAHGEEDLRKLSTDIAKLHETLYTKNTSTSNFPESEEQIVESSNSWSLLPSEVPATTTTATTTIPADNYNQNTCFTTDPSLSDYVPDQVQTSRPFCPCYLSPRTSLTTTGKTQGVSRHSSYRECRETLSDASHEEDSWAVRCKFSSMNEPIFYTEEKMLTNSAKNGSNHLNETSSTTAKLNSMPSSWSGVNDSSFSFGKKTGLCTMQEQPYTSLPNSTMETSDNASHFYTASLQEKDTASTVCSIGKSYLNKQMKASVSKVENISSPQTDGPWSSMDNKAIESLQHYATHSWKNTDRQVEKTNLSTSDWLLANSSSRSIATNQTNISSPHQTNFLQGVNLNKQLQTFQNSNNSSHLTLCDKFYIKNMCLKESNVSNDTTLHSLHFDTNDWKNKSTPSTMNYHCDLPKKKTDQTSVNDPSYQGLFNELGCDKLKNVLHCLHGNGGNRNAGNIITIQKAGVNPTNLKNDSSVPVSASTMLLSESHHTRNPGLINANINNSSLYSSLLPSVTTMKQAETQKNCFKTYIENETNHFNKYIGLNSNLYYNNTATNMSCENEHQSNPSKHGFHEMMSLPPQQEDLSCTSPNASRFPVSPLTVPFVYSLDYPANRIKKSPVTLDTGFCKSPSSLLFPSFPFSPTSNYTSSNFNLQYPENVYNNYESCKNIYKSFNSPLTQTSSRLHLNLYDSPLKNASTTLASNLYKVAQNNNCVIKQVQDKVYRNFKL